jgi:sarcosine oxidase delta subunit
VVILFLFSACSKNEIIENEDMKIEFGTACGWCAGVENITITSSKIVYSRVIPCGDNKGTSTKNRSLSKTEWEELFHLFDYNLFLTLEHNECNVCADGCDEFLKITRNNTLHELRYAPGIEVEGMENLRNRLNEILADFRE